MVPILLSLIPLAVLLWDIRSGHQSLEADQKRAWFAGLDGICDQIRRETDLTFPPREAARLLKSRARRLARTVLRNPSGRELPEAVPKLIQSALRAVRGDIRSWRLPQPKVWAFWLPRSDRGNHPPQPSQKNDLEIRPLAGEGLETTNRVVLTGIFRELVGQIGQPSPSLSPTAVGRLRTLFGPALFSGTFHPDKRGIPKHVVFEGRFQVLLWDLIPLGRSGRVGFLLVQPLSTEGGRDGWRPFLRRWKPTDHLPEIHPVFAAFPADRTASPPILHRRDFPLSLLPQVRNLQAQWKAIPGGTEFAAAWFLFQDAYGLVFNRSFLPEPLRDLANLVLYEPAEAWFVPRWNFAPSCMGRSRLDLSLFDGILDWGKWWARAFPLRGEEGGIGFLVSPKPIPAVLFGKKLAGAWFLAVALIWSVVLWWRMVGGGTSGFGVRTRFIGWFLGLVALPGAVVLGAGASFLNDLHINLIERLDQEVDLIFRAVESDGFTHATRQVSICRRLMAERGIRDRFWEYIRNGNGGPDLLEMIDRRLDAAGLASRTLLFIGPHQLYLERVNQMISSATRESLLLFAMQAASGTISLDLPGLEPWQRRPGHQRLENQPFEGLLVRNDWVVRFANSLNICRLEEQQFMLFQGPILRGGQTAMLGMTLWPLQDTFAAALRTSLNRIALRHRGIHLEAFQERGNRITPVALSGMRPDPLLGRLAAQASGRRIRREKSGELYLAFPSHQLQGFILAGRISTETLTAQLQAARRELGAFLFLLLLLVSLAGSGLSWWLASPVVRMTEGLRQVTAGNLDVHLGEGRLDELGQAMATLDTMIASFREKRKLDRFVSSQVKDLVSSGDLPEAQVPAHREAAFLVSDIRDFTRHSEAQTPREIFATLNAHLRAMTPVIQAEGGVIDRFIGDAIQAVFYEKPGSLPGRAALQAAIAMMGAHAALDQTRAAAGRFRYRIGIGIAMGRVFTGVLGNPQVRLDFTVLGEVTTQAAELENLSKRGKATRILVSSPVRDALFLDFPFLPGPEPETWELADQGDWETPT